MVPKLIFQRDRSATMRGHGSPQEGNPSDVMVHPDEMRIAESNAAQLGVSSIELMEKAGSAVADAMVRFTKPGRVLVVCGPGKNGGDGLVVARSLLQRGYPAIVLLSVSPSSLVADETKLNWGRYLQLGGIHIATDQERWRDEASGEARRSKMIVDALFGTGIRDEISGNAATIIDLMNSSKKPIVSVDTPSGLDPFTGTACSKVVHARTTVTFQAMKKGLTSRPDLTGKVFVADIGIPRFASLFIDREDVLSALPARDRFAHKGDYGVVLVVGGSELYSGAPALAALAALRTGAGLSMVASPDSVASSIRSMSPDLIVRGLPGGRLGPGHLNSLRAELDRATVVAVGPGIGRAEDSLKAILEIAELALAEGKKLVVDADALDISGKLAATASPKSLVLTPHAGEFKRLTGKDVGPHWPERVHEVQQFAKSGNCTVILKGHHTVISDGFLVKVNRGGNPGMSKGGTGDILTGVVSGLLAQGSSTLQAACAATYICGMAADKLFKSKGFHYTASDLLTALPEVLKDYDRYSG
ncbi:MAG TPA: NAD(P)H-hydrate dehydratase [Thermoproteota archaeon]|nr:NAD(P)H-hydrate dehydratase [Thermoproteota archaeon]